MIFCQGNIFTIEETDDAVTSRPEAELQAQPTSSIAQLKALIERFANSGKLRSPDQMNSEGNGFYAIKARSGLRAYGWYHSRKRHVFVISHYICKKRQKLDPADIERAERNKAKYESDI